MATKNHRTHTGVYPGTFDPVTNGHLDIIERALPIVDRLIIAVAVNKGKFPLFDVDERIDMIETEVARLKVNGKSIDVRPFEELLVNFTASVGANVIVRGLRAVSDFEYEFQMASTNARLNPAIETVFLMASDRHQFTSSRLVKEIAELKGDISDFVSPRVARRIMKQLKKKQS
ncbi:MAG: pantetheine-phosphate adenylyltransferase [Alphaproteobacteria bacterium]|nr:pantetheine-phosphate adenylyltransferase [Alphaproteobacteria bacterium]